VARPSRVGHAEVVVFSDHDRTGIFTARRARRIASNLKGSETLVHRVVREKTTDERSPSSNNNLIVSIAWIEPTMPGKTPNTPASRKLGASSGVVVQGSCSGSTVRRTG